DASRVWQAAIAPGNFAISSPVRVTSGEAIETQPFTDSKGRVVFSRESYNADIWGVPVLPNEGKVTGEARRWTRDPGVDVSPSLSGDGARLLFQSNRAGRYNVWMLDVKSGKESPVKASPEEQLWPQISPDGGRLAFSELRIGHVEHFYKSV